MRTETLRKLLSIGELTRCEMVKIMGGHEYEVADSLMELRGAGHVKIVRDGRQQQFYRITDEANAFKQ